MHNLTIVLPPDPVLFEFATVFSIFAIGAKDHYAVRVCHHGGGPVSVHGAMSLMVDDGLAAVETADTVIVPGMMADLDQPLPEVLLRSLRLAHARGCRMVSICTGSFVLAAAGLLNGRCATTHWKNVDEMRALFPRVRIDPAVLYVDDGKILSAAGATAGIDLCLHMVRSDLGQALADDIARHMVVGPHRGGEYAKYIDYPPGSSRSRSLEATRRWVLERLNQPISVPRMADHACLSVRAFARRFHDETGSAPHRWLVAQRLRLARQLLEESNLLIDEVARRCGFGSTLSFRDHFKRQLQTTPSGYRQMFRAHREASLLPSAA